MVISLIMVISQCIHISKIALYTLHIYNFICQSYFNKAGGKKALLYKLSNMVVTSPYKAEHLKHD